MNRMLFKEGGQPIYLDDLKLLQQNQDDMWTAVMNVISGGAGAMLLEPVSVTTESVNTGNLSQTVIVGDGKLIVEGGLVPFKGKKLTIPKEGSVYICVKKSEEDIRIFADGAERTCIESITASVMSNNTGAYKSYKLEDLHTLMEQLNSSIGNAAKVEKIRVLFSNGYHGDFTMKKIDNGNDWQFSLKITTSEKEWNAAAPGYKGMLFTTEDDVVERMLHNRRTPVFSYGQQDYTLLFSSSSPACVLWPNGVKDIYQPDVEIPLIPIDFTWKYSEMTEMV